MSFPCNCSGKQCLTCSRRTYQEGSLGQVRADISILFRVMEKVHNLFQRVLGFLLACNIRKGNPGFAFRIYLSIGLAKGHGIASAHTLGYHTAHNLADNDKHQDRGHPGHKKA